MQKERCAGEGVLSDVGWTQTRKDSTSSGSQSVPEEDIVCLSFREHILNWLKACKSCENTGMVPILEQFIQNIEQISGYTSEKVRNMVIDELLKSGDSLRAGMQIADSINAAKAKLSIR